MIRIIIFPSNNQLINNSETKRDIEMCELKTKSETNGFSFFVIYLPDENKKKYGRRRSIKEQ